MLFEKINKLQISFFIEWKEYTYFCSKEITWTPSPNTNTDTIKGIAWDKPYTLT